MLDTIALQSLMMLEEFLELLVGDAHCSLLDDLRFIATLHNCLLLGLMDTHVFLSLSLRGSIHGFWIGLHSISNRLLKLIFCEFMICKVWI